MPDVLPPGIAVSAILRNRITAIAGSAAAALIILFFGFTRVIPPALYSAPTPTIRPTPTPEVVTAEGTIVPVQRVALAFKIGGRVAEIQAQEGDEVKEGTLLAKLDDATLQAQVSQAEAAYRAAQTQLARTQAANAAQTQSAAANLAKLKAGPTPEELAVAEGRVQEAATASARAQESFDRLRWIGGPTEADVRFKRDQAAAAHATALADLARIKAGARAEDLAAAQAQLDLAQGDAGQAEIKAAQAQVDQAQAALELAQAAAQDALLVAPFDGTVSLVSMDIGQVVAPGATVMLFGNLGQMQVETNDLAEVDVRKILVGQAVNVTVDAFPGKIFKGRVIRVAPAASDRRGDKVYKVTLDLPDGAVAGLRWGMTATVEIVVGE